MTGLSLDMAAALSAARELGAAGWASAELLLAIRTGMAEGTTLEGGALKRRLGESLK